MLRTAKRERDREFSNVEDLQDGRAGAFKTEGRGLNGAGGKQLNSWPASETKTSSRGGVGRRRQKSTVETKMSL